MIKKIAFNFFLHSKKGFKKYLRENGLTKIREKIANLHNMYVFDSDEKIFDEPKKKIFNQFLGQKLLYQRFIWVFFYFYSKKKKIIFPLPNKWQESLDKSGTTINKFFSNIFYYFILIYFFFTGVVYFFSKIIEYFYYFFFLKKNLKFKNYTIFANLSANKVKLNSKSKYNLHNWYLNNIDRDARIIYMSKDNQNYVNNNLAEAKSEFFLFYKSFKLFKFILLFFKSISEFKKISLLEYNLLLFKEVIELNFYRSINTKNIKKVLFIWTNNIYKPLWTYELEKKGIEVSVLFNGFLNEIRLSEDLKFNHDHEGLSKLTWNSYLTWDKSTLYFLNEKVKKKINVKVTGPIYFNDVEKDFEVPEKSISVFGYENHKQNIGINTITDYEYCSKKFLEKFYEDIYEVSSKFNYTIIIKRKNNLKHLEIKKNKFFFKNYLKKPNVISIDPDISAFRVIKKTFLNISMPFTSTALIGKEFRKNTIYYDPFNWIQKNDPSGSNINLISGKSNLDKYFREI